MADPALSYPLGDPPAIGAAIAVSADVRWMRMPLPFALNHINVYAVRDGDGWAVFDTGIRGDETSAAWRKLFGAGGALGDDAHSTDASSRPGRPSRLFATHMHPDHIGMAGWLTRTYGVQLWMTRLEYLTCRMLAADTGREAPGDAIEFYRRAGWTDESIDKYRAKFGDFGKMIYAFPDSFRRLRDGETICIGGHEWQVIVGNGHSPEHACFYCVQLGLLISGDQVLPRISSNVSVYPTEPDADPLGDWLDSIGTLRQNVPDDVLVLPSHNEPFRGLHARLNRLESGHRAALDRLRAKLHEPKRVVDLFEALFARPITSERGLLSLATGESLAHLNYLRRRHELDCDLDADGIAWYRLRDAPNAARD